MIDYILLGIIQGLTEFLPVSSSGHLVIAQKLLGTVGNEIAVSIILHLGTTLALLVFLFKDIVRLSSDRKSIFFIIVVSIITGTIGIAGKGFFESLFSSVKPIAIALLFTGIILILTRKLNGLERKNLNLKDALVFGLAQGAAIIPGISRSGITISTLLFRKVDRETAFKFSFLASLPAIFGATLLEAKKIDFILQVNPLSLAFGFVASFLVGILSLSILRFILLKDKFYYFGYYCIFLAALILIFLR